MCRRMGSASCPYTRTRAASPTKSISKGWVYHAGEILGWHRRRCCCRGGLSRGEQVDSIHHDFGAWGRHPESSVQRANDVPQVRTRLEARGALRHIPSHNKRQCRGLSTPISPLLLYVAITIIIFLVAGDAGAEVKTWRDNVQYIRLTDLYHSRTPAQQTQKSPEPATHSRT